MTSQQKTIAWEKWEDSEVESSPNSLQALFSPALDMEETQEEPTEYDLAGFFESIPKLVNTPMGMYNVNDKMSPTKQFDCWLGYTDFDITHEVQEIIEQTPGVEVLMVLTRYRFFIGIGKLFSFRDVRVNIEKQACSSPAYHDHEPTSDAIYLLKEDLSSHKYWAIFVFPNGELNCISSDSDNDKLFKETLLLYKNAKLITGGVLLHSDDI
mgnify:CR=1 FL=1|jgi:hypothetical protein